MNATQSSLDEGRLLIAYSDKSGGTVGVEFSAVASSQATLLIGACSVAASDKPKRIVTSAVIDDTDIIQTSTNDGGDDMEKRLAVLETEVSHIKSDVSELKADVKQIASDVASIQRDMAVVLQKVIDIDKGLSEKPSTSAMNGAIASAANKQIVWTIGIAFAILGLAKYMF